MDQIIFMWPQKSEKATKTDPNKYIISDYNIWFFTVLIFFNYMYDQSSYIINDL